MRVALDLEGVLVDTHAVFMKELDDFVKAEHPEVNRNFTRSDITGWEFKGLRDTFAELRGWDEEATEKFMFGDGNGWKGFMPITEKIWRQRPEDIPAISDNVSNAVEQISDHVRENGGKICLVTARKNVDESVEKKVDQLGIREALDEVIIEDDKHELGFNVYIDDFPGLYRQVGEGERHIMIDQPWNKSVELEKPHVRASNIEEAAKVIQNLG